MTPRRRATAKPAASHALRASRALFALLVFAALAAGVAGGLLRAGVALGDKPVPWLAQAVVAHAFLMVCAFFGAVIGIERAVAVKRRWAFAAPLGAGLAGVLVLAGLPDAAAWLAVGAAAVFVAVNGVVVTRQRAAHTVLLLVAALALWAGSLGHATGWLQGAVLPLWLAFLVLTIAAERLEMTRLTRRPPGAAAALHAVLALMLGGALLSAAPAGSLAGGVAYGLGLLGLALWLMCFDIARRTVRAPGLPRYMALCLLPGYGWLAVAGVAWMAMAAGLPARDMALHALALGFVFSMVFGHAPVILPAVAGVRLQFGRAFYLPLLLLHLSLALRLFGAPLDGRWLGLGATLHGVALASFMLTLAGAALAWRIRHHAQEAHHEHAVHH
ncbi:hypothetical protein [Pseudorhodoferax sp.]|uniref:hypothetical protein n=1 Tax=Pseudorhodoferax sp. TaxID=1993553 RepID=UPI002DD690C7|nr:hypothetical protein [Pseudorhodoferax sp.]